jgi:ketosteroid isomerase-like protein
VHAVVQAFLHSDWERLGELYRDDSELTLVEGWPEPGPFRGREECVRQWQRLHSDFSSHELRVTDLGESRDRALVRTDWVATGSGSGAEAGLTAFGAYRIQDGQVAEAHFYRDRDEAARDAGLGG